MIKGIILDFDGTLFHTDYLGKKVIVEICKEKGIDFDGVDWEKLPGLNREDRIKILFPDRVEELLLAYTKKYAEKFVKSLIELGNSEKVIPRLAKKYKLFIFSTKYVELIKSALVAKDLLQYFTEIIGYETLENKKPQPEGIFKIMKENTFSNKEIVLVGDSPLDKKACENAKIKFILFNNSNEEKNLKNNLTIQNFLDLEEILDKL